MRPLDILLLALQYWLSPVLAFNPSWGLVLGNEAMGRTFGGGIWGTPHEGMTAQAIDSRVADYFGITVLPPSVKDARKAIGDGSKVVDDHYDKTAVLPNGKLGSEAEISSCHFDDESFEESNQRLIDMKSKVKAELQDGSIVTARTLLGRALHTLQDFYSHSNWVELEMPDISQNLGLKYPLDIPHNNRNGTKTCVECSYKGIREVTVKAADVCRLLPKVAGLLANLLPFGWGDEFDHSPMGLPGKILTAGCMLIGEGFAAYDDVQLAWELFIATGVFISPADIGIHFVEWPECLAPPNLLYTGVVSEKLLTTGYFGAGAGIHDGDKPDGKCSHGGPFDRNADGLEGICKDTASHFLSPHADLHPRAVEFARKATEKYLDELKDMLCTAADGSTMEPKNCPLLKKLYGVGGLSLAIVIDTTGSMGSIIDQVRQQAIATVNAQRGAFNGTGYFVLSEIQDPAPASAIAFTDIDAFIGAISKLGASGGGDCPEYAMMGVANALDKMPEGGILHLWTDAAAKDVSMAKDVAKRAQDLGVSVFTYLFGTTGCQSSEGFDLLSSDSGGQHFSGLAVSEAKLTAELAGKFAQALRVLIWAIKRVGPLIKRQDTTFTYDIPVDTAMDSLTLSLSGAGVTMDLIRPNGVLVSSTDVDAEMAKLTTGAIYSISKPAVGIWKTKVTGSTFSISVFGTGTLQFDIFRFVRFGGSHHVGFFPMTTIPVSGSRVVAEAAVDGDFDTVDFEFRSLAGDSLAHLNMTAGSGEEHDMPANIFYGFVDIPDKPFNVYITGKDKSGALYQRVLTGILSPVASNTTLPSNSTTNSTSTLRWSNSSSTATATSYTACTTCHDVTTTATTSPLTTVCPTCHGSTRRATATSYTTVCPACQPSCEETPIAILTQTIIYYTSVCSSEGMPYTTSTVTTTINVPCFSDCRSTTLEVISPCPSCSTPPFAGNEGATSTTAVASAKITGTSSPTGPSTVTNGTSRSPTGSSLPKTPTAVATARAGRVEMSITAVAVVFPLFLLI